MLNYISWITGTFCVPAHLNENLNKSGPLQRTDHNAFISVSLKLT